MTRNYATVTGMDSVTRQHRRVLSNIQLLLVLPFTDPTATLTQPAADALTQTATQVCHRAGATLDHLHLHTGHAVALVTIPPTITAAQLVMTLKARTSRAVHDLRDRPGPTLWSPSYYAGIPPHPLPPDPADPTATLEGDVQRIIIDLDTRRPRGRPRTTPPATGEDDSR